jgi:hypothetical protein
MSADSALSEITSEDWNVYRTRFLIRAKQLTQPLSFKDALGREHSGVAGDYLVQSAEGMFRIAPREIFEDIYVRMEEAEATSRSWGLDPSSARLSA